MVDGDNITHALQLHRPPEIEAFLQKLELAAVAKDWEILVVFDGPQRFLPREQGPLIVQYALGCSADSMIERRVYQATDRFAVVVVTQDRAEADLVRAMGARVWNARRLQEELG